MRTYVALGQKMGVFDCELREACEKHRFVVKPTCLDYFVFPAVKDGFLTPTKTVCRSLRDVVPFFGGVGSLILFSYPPCRCEDTFPP